MIAEKNGQMQCQLTRFVDDNQKKVCKDNPVFEEIQASRIDRQKRRGYDQGRGKEDCSDQ